MEGEAWLPQISPHLRAIHQTADDLFGHGQRQVTLVASASIVQNWLIPRLHKITPADRLSLSLSTMVVERDFAPDTPHIRYGTGPWPGQNAARLFEEALTPVTHPDLAAQHWHHLPRDHAFRPPPRLGRLGCPRPRAASAL